jgi:HD-GYP domain-containing protein (c-di-GMP phosphodiesterase class II)
VKGFKKKNFILAKEDYTNVRHIVLCREYPDFISTNLSESYNNELINLFRKVTILENSAVFIKQYINKKLHGSFEINVKTILNKHFYVIFENIEPGLNLSDNLLFSSAVQDKLRSFMYWRDIDDKAKLLMQCLVKKDTYTAGHTKRVGLLCKELAQVYNLSDYEIKVCYYSGLLHDIGKIGVDDSILKKKSSLTDTEFSIMKDHPTHSYDILKTHILNKDIIDGVRFHHEKVDGSGYPLGLKRDEIPLAARVVAVADTFDALISHRPYRKGVAPLEAINKIRKIGPGQLDEKIVEALCTYVLASQMAKKSKKAA